MWSHLEGILVPFRRHATNTPKMAQGRADAPAVCLKVDGPVLQSGMKDLYVWCCAEMYYAIEYAEVQHYSVMYVKLQHHVIEYEAMQRCAVVYVGGRHYALVSCGVASSSRTLLSFVVATRTRNLK